MRDQEVREVNRPKTPREGGDVYIIHCHCYTLRFGVVMMLPEEHDFR